MKTRALGVTLAATLALGLTAAVQTPRLASAEEGAACGSKANPCPLQGWMTKNVGGPMASGDLKAVAAGLDKAATLVPDDAWKADWSKFSKDGAEAARKGDTAAVKASCKSCHDKFKNSYKEKYRTRAVP